MYLRAIHILDCLNRKTIFPFYNAGLNHIADYLTKPFKQMNTEKVLKVSLGEY